MRTSGLFLAMLLSAAPLAATVVDWSLVTVDNEAVTYTAYLRAYDEIREAVVKFGAPDARIDTPSSVLDKVVNNEILTLEARKKEIDVSEQEIDERLEMFKKMNNLNDEMFRQVLKQQDVKLEDLRKNYREQIRNEKLQQIEIRNRIKQPTDEDLRKFYDENKARMMYPERRRVLHILFVPDPEATLSEQAKMKKDLEGVYMKAMAPGSDFARLAREYSMDEVSRSNGGDIGWVEQGSMSPEFEMAVFRLKKNEISQPFQSRAGIHIAKVVEIKPAAPMPFEEAKATIRNMVLQRSLDEAFVRWVQAKRGAYGIRVFLRDGRSFVLEKDVWTGEADGKKYGRQEFLDLLDAEFKKYQAP
jgi:foldase protein PrsA